MACVVAGCNEQIRSKYLMCSKHWYKLPETLRDDVRLGTDKGTHTLRAHPTREWLGLATKYVGSIRNLSIRVDADNKVKRKFQDAAQVDEPTTALA